ncbi:hypothetical protein AB0M46_31920, partial [Dactylosporangium sp. NPDC051485]
AFPGRGIGARRSVGRESCIRCADISPARSRPAPPSGSDVLPAVDELVIKLDPVIAARSFDPHRFRLIDADPLDSGVAVLRCRAR